jgi:hypothetical protein
VANRALPRCSTVTSILDDRGAVLFDGHDADKPAPDKVRRPTHKDLKTIVDAIDARNARRTEELVADHLLMRTLATINTWQQGPVDFWLPLLRPRLRRWPSSMTASPRRASGVCRH